MAREGVAQDKGDVDADEVFGSHAPGNHGSPVDVASRSAKVIPLAVLTPPRLARA